MMQSIVGLATQWPYINDVCCLALLDSNPGWCATEAENLLSAAEKADGADKSSASYRAWLLGRLAGKAAAAEFWGIAPKQAEIVRHPDGWPKLNLPGGRTGCLSISHSAGAALAVAANWPDRCGVDLERLDRPIVDKAWLWAFASEERELAENAPPGEIPPRLALWCAKEAAAKAWGLGLLNHLAQVRATKADWAAGMVDVTLADIGPVPVKLMIQGPYLVALAKAGGF